MKEELKDFIVDAIFFLAFGILAFLLGRYAYPDSQCDKPTILGLYTSYQNDSSFWLKGDWVHVNVANMDYAQAIKVCRHEVFHEIWAECGEDNNLTSCIDKYNKYNEEGE